MTVTVTNISTQTQQLVDPGCYPGFAVTNAAGVRVGPPMYTFCLATLKPVTLAPGEEYVFAQLWQGDTFPVNGSITFLPPGTYVVSGILRTDGVSVRQVPTSIQLTQ